MIRLALPIAALTASAALAQNAEQKLLAPDMPDVAAMDQAERNCEDRIQQVRAESGQPKLDRGTTDGSEALFIAAVDQRIDGCAVMVMRRDTSDIRPLPKPSEDVRIVPID